MAACRCYFDREDKRGYVEIFIRKKAEERAEFRKKVFLREAKDE